MRNQSWFWNLDRLGHLLFPFSYKKQFRKVFEDFLNSYNSFCHIVWCFWKIPQKAQRGRHQSKNYSKSTHRASQRPPMFARCITLGIRRIPQQDAFRQIVTPDILQWITGQRVASGVAGSQVCGAPSHTWFPRCTSKLVPPPLPPEWYE